MTVNNESARLSELPPHTETEMVLGSNSVNKTGCSVLLTTCDGHMGLTHMQLLRWYTAATSP